MNIYTPDTRLDPTKFTQSGESIADIVSESEVKDTPDLWDSVRVEFNYEHKINTLYGALGVADSHVQKQIDTLKQIGAYQQIERDIDAQSKQDLEQALKNKDENYDLNTYINTTERYYSYISKHPELIQQLKEQYPDSNLLTSEEIDNEIFNEFNQTMSEYQRVNKYESNFGGFLGFFGTVGGFVTTPEGFGTALMPLPQVKLAAPLLGTFVKSAAFTAPAIAATEYINKPTEVTIRRLLGEDVTDEQAVKESLASIGFGSLAAGALTAGGAALGKAFVKPLEDLQADLSRPVNISEALHGQALNKAMQDTLEGKAIDTSAYFKATSTTDLDTFKATVSNDVLESGDLRGKLTAQDIKVNIIDDATGDVNTRSGRELVTEIEQDQKALNILNKCLTTGKIDTGEV